MLMNAVTTLSADRVRPRVLVVDDESAFAEVVAEILEEGGFDARPISDPDEALRLTREGCDVALLDLAMPLMSGLDLAERVREVSPYTEVVILTGQADLDAARGGIHVGAYDFLLKSDFSAATIEATVRAAAQKGRRRRDQNELVERLADANRLLAALQELGATDRGALSPRVVLSRLVSAAKEITGAAAGRALRFTPTHDEEGLVVEEAVGDGAGPLRGARLGPSEGIATFAALVGEGAQVEIASDHPRYSHKCDELPALGPGFLCVPLVSGSVKGALSLAGLPGGFSAEAVAAAERLAAQAAMSVENLLAQDRSLNFFTHVSEILVSILDCQDVFNQGHSRTVATLADMVTRGMGLGDAERRQIHYSALLHDIGKTRIAPSLLNTAGRYGPAARREMQEHVALGVEMLKPITQFAELLPIIHAHHERWDGAGYPSGLAGEDIPLGARVIAVADAFDAMTHGRPHASRLGEDEALRELEEEAGRQFDPRVVRLFVDGYREHRNAGRP